MKNVNIHKILFVSILFVLVQLSVVNTASALSLMGPPRSILQPEENAFGIELGYSSMDLESFGDVTEKFGLSTTQDYSKYEIDSIKSISPSVRLDTNVFKNWDIFLRAGLTDGSGEITEEQAGGSTGRQYDDFDGGYGLSFGLGTRTTFYEQDNTTWGAIFQANWVNPGDSDITDKSDTNFSGNAELNFWEVQIAIGPTVQFETVRVYGGPFLHFVNGELEINGTTTATTPSTSLDISHDVREKSQIGGFLGAQWYLGNNNTLVTEMQFTPDAFGITVGTAWKF